MPVPLHRRMIREILRQGFEIGPQNPIQAMSVLPEKHAPDPSRHRLRSGSSIREACGMVGLSTKEIRPAMLPRATHNR